ncbi:MAG: cupredoxin domain-containing protein [Alphaproteobacteria bacterium]|nr:cupredoxin domain-containing protein [Alphaproteobacteria bacterium]
MLGRQAIAAAVALATAAAGALTLAQAAPESAPEPAVIRISAKKFEYTPTMIVLKKGVPVVLELTAVDRIHGFKVPALGIRSDVLPDQTVRVALTPDKAGRFVFACDVFCGDGHEDMDGAIVVEE